MQIGAQQAIGSPMPKKTFFNLPDDKRERITQLAINEFSAHPYRSASLSNIVAQAGIAKGSIYQYFQNKFDLYRWLVLEEIPRRKRAWMANHPPPTGLGFYEQLEHRLLMGFRFGMSLPHANRLAQALLEPTSDPQLLALHQSAQALTHQGMRALVEQARADGALREDIDTDVAAAFIAAVMRSGLSQLARLRTGHDLYTLLSKAHQGEVDFPESLQRQLVHEIVRMMQRGLAGREPPAR
ncbi:MAG: TetR/AcrR family transcriptional regulator [Myxococcota bacterium]